MSKLFTVVFRVEDGDAFKGFAHSITNAFAAGEHFSGAEITGVGWCDAMTESDLMRDWIDSNGGDADAVARGEA